MGPKFVLNIIFQYNLAKWAKKYWNLILKETDLFRLCSIWLILYANLIYLDSRWKTDRVSKLSLPPGWPLDRTDHQWCLIYLQSGSNWPQMGQIRDFFRSDFRTFSFFRFVPFVANLTHFWPKSKSPAVRYCDRVRQFWTLAQLSNVSMTAGVTGQQQPASGPLIKVDRLTHFNHHWPLTELIFSPRSIKDKLPTLIFIN